MDRDCGIQGRDSQRWRVSEREKKIEREKERDG